MQSNRISFLSAYGAFWKYYAEFGQRTAKEAFWKAWALQNAILLILSSPVYYVFSSLVDRWDFTAIMWLIPCSIYSVATLVPTIAIVLRRLHDIDRSGCWIFLFLVPIAGQIVFFIMLVRPSAPYDVYPGMSGSGPYNVPGSGHGAYGQSAYGQSAYGQGAYRQGGGMYGQPQNPYGGQGAYGPGAYGPGGGMYGQPQNPYAFTPPPYGYAQMPPPPQPKRYAPPAGGNDAFGAVVLSIILVAANIGYSIATEVYFHQMLSGLILNDLYNSYNNGYSDPGSGGYGYSDPYPWDGGNGYSDPGYGYSDPGYGYSDPGNGGDYWGYGNGGDNGYGNGLTADEQAAVDLVRNSSLPGFSDFTIEDVLLSQVDADGLEWDCFDEEGGDYPSYYVTAIGYLDGSFEQLYAGFDVYDDGTIEVYNLDNGDRDEYGKDALGLYKEWYDSILASGGSSHGA